MADDNENGFDKFMDDILLKEQKQVKKDEEEETPARKLARRAKELVSNRTRWGSK